MRILFAVCLLAAAPAVAQSNKAIKTWDVKTIVWQQTFEDGSKYSVLEGDKNAKGQQFTYAMFIPAGSWDTHSHAHNQDARLVVLSGALRLAMGLSADKTGSKAYQAGSYVLVPANLPHTMGADVDTIIIGTASGPWVTHDNPEAHRH